MQENDQNRLITPWGYIGYGILFAIPIVGLICALVFSFSSSYPCRKNYARSFLIGIVIAIVIAVIMILAGYNFAALLDRSYRYYY